MKFDGWKEDKALGRKPLYYWKKYRKNEPIPDELRKYESSSDESSDSESSSS